MFIALACERSVDGLEEPGFTENPDVFIDGFSSGLNYLPFADSDQDAFSVDTDDTYNNTAASMRFDVPNVGDPEGGYAGAIFRDENGGRNLTSYNALTFYAKGTVAGTLNEIGFGQDFGENEFIVSLNNTKLTTNWEQYVVPIPDASNLTAEQGLLWYAEGPEDGDGYSFWLDEVKFENLEDLAQPRPVIQNGEEVTQTSFIGANVAITGLNYTANTVTPDGVAVDVTVNAAPAYYTFFSSDPSVATVNEEGQISVVGEGTSEITASLAGNDAQGKLIVESIGEFSPAPTPTEASENVISVFSDAYDNVPVDYYNGFFNGDGQTTQGGTGPGGADITVNGDGVINYTDLNFVGIGAFQNVPSIDASSMTHFSVDIYVNEEVESGDFIRLQLINSVGSNESSGSVTINSNTLLENDWVSLDIPLANFGGLSDRSQIGLIFFISDATISDIYVDNIYFYDDSNN